MPMNSVIQFTETKTFRATCRSQICLCRMISFGFSTPFVLMSFLMRLCEASVLPALEACGAVPGSVLGGSGGSCLCL